MWSYGLGRHERVAGECARQRAGPHGLALEGHRGIEDGAPVAPVLHVHQQAAARSAEAPVVIHVHRHERRDVELLAEAKAHLVLRTEVL